MIESMCTQKYNNTVATPDPDTTIIRLSLFAQGLAKGKLGGIVNGGLRQLSLEL